MIEFDQDRRKWLLAAAGFLCFLAAFGIVLSFKGKFGIDTTPEKAAPTLHSDRANIEQAEQAEPVWAVYVTGAVIRPGVYKVASGGRIDDAVRTAGGFSIHADPEAINLAARLSDGAHIKIPERKEREEGPQPHANDPKIQPTLSETSNGNTDIYPIDLNSATHAELCTLPGIGPKLAGAIIEYRESNGPFVSVDDICLVRGIGAKKLEGIREFVVAAAER